MPAEVNGDVPGTSQNRAALAGHLARSARSRSWYSWTASLVLWLLATVLAVLFCNWVVPGFHADTPWGPLGFAVVLGVAGLLLQPLLVAGAVRLGWVGVLLLVLVGQALIVGVAAWLLPRVHVDGFWPALLVSWIIGIVSTVVGWISTAGTDEALVGRLVASSRRHPIRVDDPQVPGVIFVQLDGVPFPVLHMSVVAGTVPTLSRWIRAGSHVLHEWTPKLPATTPASQMGILHGVIDGIPAFRWYDRAEDKVVVANRPADAALIETALTTGRGLLVDGGASISNLFTGDAPTAALTMSRRARGGETTRRAVAQFVTHPTGLTRSLSRTISELGRDRFQARRAIRLDVRPRCRRTWTTALLRSVTNGALRDINTVLVAQHILRGTRSVYVDYVDYDELAHHAGILAPESLGALESVDAVVRQLELVATVSPRPYRFVVLSDHGQAQGETFADRYGEELAVVVSRLARTNVAASDKDVEGWGRTRVLVDELATGSGVSGRSMRNASGAMQRRDKNQPDSVDAGSGDRAATTTGEETFHVFGSGNLGLIYVRGEERRLTRGQIDERFPALVAGLAEHPGVGFVAVLDEAEGPLVLGAEGSRRLTDGHVEGVDPLAPFGPYAAEFVLRVALRPEAPDIYVNSLLEDGTEEVAAFEDLVGCHGGLGGWQERAFVVVPSDLPFPSERVIGADSLHVALKAILSHLGHRTNAPDERSPTRPAPADAEKPAWNQ
jgi:uncharacterized membrane protein YvlD (DUF360 family)